MVKIIVQVNKGLITSIMSTEEIQICVIDFDNIQQGISPISEDAPVIQQDLIFTSGKAYEIFTDESDSEEMEAREQLKTIKF